MVDLCLFLWLSIWGNFLPTVSLNVSIVKTVRGAAISLPGWENGLSLDCTLLDHMTGHLCTLLSSETVKHYMMDCLDFYKVFRAAESFVPPSGEHPEHRSSCVFTHRLYLFWLEEKIKAWTGQQSLTGLIQIDRQSFRLMFVPVGSF